MDSKLKELTCTHIASNRELNMHSLHEIAMSMNLLTMRIFALVGNVNTTEQHVKLENNS